jgi:hypothetical protein
LGSNRFSQEIFTDHQYSIYEEKEMRKRILKKIEQRTEERQREGEYSIEIEKVRH